MERKEDISRLDSYSSNDKVQVEIKNGYDRDKFGTVIGIYLDKISFITDSGKGTWKRLRNFNSKK